MRLDTFLVGKYGFSRNKIQQFIALDLVLINGITAKKSSQKIQESDEILILEDRRTVWVSRSAEKLFAFFEDESNYDLREKIAGADALDVGSSTGGFTQVLLLL